MMEGQTNTLYSIENNYSGFQQLIDLYVKNKEAFFENISIDITGFFAANMCAPLQAVLEKLFSGINNINLSVSLPEARLILQKNNFLSFYGLDRMDDVNKTTISFVKFKRTESRFFVEYVKTELLNRNDIMPIMSESLRNEICLSICEIFANACMHTESPYIFTCGQFFPHKHLLNFTIADIGEGIKNKVNSSLGKNFTSIEAIQWALIDGNTTKEGVPGGYGLFILQRLIRMNGGFMQIVSDDGFYQLDTNGEIKKIFSGTFPGTVVNLQFRTDDTSSYSLKNERNK